MLYKQALSHGASIQPYESKHIAIPFDFPQLMDYVISTEAKRHAKSLRFRQTRQMLIK